PPPPIAAAPAIRATTIRSRATGRSPQPQAPPGPTSAARTRAIEPRPIARRPPSARQEPGLGNGIGLRDVGASVDRGAGWWVSLPRRDHGHEPVVRTGPKVLQPRTSVRSARCLGWG